MTPDKKCFQCGNPGIKLYDYIICDQCKSKLGLFTDATIKNHIAKYKNPPGKRTYEEEINYRLDFLEKDLIKKRIKLLHIKERLNNM